MRIFSRHPRSHRLTGPLPIDPETGLYNRNFFLLRLNEERERTKRTGSPFSLLVANVQSISIALNGTVGSFAGIHPARLVEQLSKETRKIDIKGWLNVQNAGILMPNTQESGAFEVKEKIRHRIKKKWPAAGGLNLDEFFQIYTFGAHSPGENDSASKGFGVRSSGNTPKDHAVYADILKTDLFSFIKRFTKRLCDIVGSLLGIIIASPLMLVIAVLIKLTSPGPVLFRQERIGFGGRRFIFLKFRSMVFNAEHIVHQQFVSDLINGLHDTINRGSEGSPLYKMCDDPRVTPIGSVLRKTSLDELPQLFNVLKGDMSLVGPRPPIPYEVENYKLWHSGRVFEVKPGLTGLWQVSGRSQTTFDDMVRLDLQYANSWSLWLDFKIILKTFRAVISTKGAY